ncbi:MAG TPA: 3-hydroxyacyl-CoA dehydrogenase family protein [Candidatus Angelobacter sp.]|nr:3-hydroxyacyl-CoA dehydrogenase family protein [Candidatus Angelobacter sp.]
MERCQEKTRGTLENGRVGKEGKSSREVIQVRVAVIGFGLMGRQIAQVFAQHGHEVKVTDESPIAVRSGLDEVAHGPYGIESAIAKAKMTREEGTKTLRQIRPALDLKDACNDADLVIEAVYELLSLKQEVFKKLELVAPRTALLASNTSTLTVSKIGARLSRKDRLLGMHFFNPAQITKLVEIVKTGETSEATIQQASKIVETVRKTPIIANDEPGFIANRLGLTLYMEASALLEEGTAKIRDIDLAMKLGYNHPMGPFELADFVGLDTRLRNLEALFQATGDEKWMPPKALREMVNQGYLGDPSRRRGSKGGYREFFKKAP